MSSCIQREAHPHRKIGGPSQSSVVHSLAVGKTVFIGLEFYICQLVLMFKSHTSAAAYVTFWGGNWRKEGAINIIDQGPH